MTLNRDSDLEGLENNKVVYERSPHEPFEAPVKEVEKGPLYVNIEEVIPELAAELEEASQSPEVVDKVEEPALAVDRRDFMRLFSASALLASAACVRRPVEEAVPYANQPVDQLPGVPVHYATTCGECTSGCGLVVKTREGRPVKVDGHPKHPVSQGATCSLGQASLQALYHPERRKDPMIRFGVNRVNQVSWDDVYDRLSGVMKGKRVAILTGGSTGSRHEFFRRFLEKTGSEKSNLYTYEPQTLQAEMAAAYKMAFGVEGFARSEIRRSEIIVGIGADFLDIGVSHVYESKSWAAGHAFHAGRKGRLIQFESRLTNTGGKAAERHPIAAGDELAVTLALVKALAENGKARGSSSEKAEIQKVIAAQKNLISEVKQRVGLDDAFFNKLASDMLEKATIVMVGSSGANDENSTLLQIAGIMANVLVGAYGNTLHFDTGWAKSAVNPGDMARFFENAGNIDVLFVVDCDPAFTLPPASGIADILKNIPFVVSMQTMPNETDQQADFILNIHHYLETWGDEEPVAGFWSLRQPTVRPVTNSRQAEDIMLWLLAKLGSPMPFASYREYLMDQWQAVAKLVDANVSFDTFFKAVQRRGFVGRLEKRSMPSLGNIAERFTPVQRTAGGLRLIAHLDNRFHAGKGANRPILQEVPDSLTTVCWDTWVGINPNKAKELGLKYNDVVRVEGRDGSFEASVYPLPGLHPDTIVVPRGNGHAEGLSKITGGVGVNPLVALSVGHDVVTRDFVTSGQEVKIVRTGKFYRLAAQQKHNDVGNRTDIVKSLTLGQARAGLNKRKDLDDVPDLYPKLPEGEYRWGMSIDLEKCSGCSACMVACSVENNIPQVGRKQILMGREMHWIRLDRYFEGPTDNPTVTFQPMPCQHCNHAPCEAVCPVYATTHDPEGMNVQTYNRCIGTRYCANACPYKVRRFNWFTHQWNIMGERATDRNPRAVNPDVTVRTRGIMEKCTFCAQRIRDAKHAAKERGPNAKVFDGEIQTACEQACPSDAIVFGNLLDPRSRISNLRGDNRAYLALGGDPEHAHYGIKTLPNVNYMAKVVYSEVEDPMAGHGHDHGDHGGHEGEHPSGESASEQPGAPEGHPPPQEGDHEGAAHPH